MASALSRAYVESRDLPHREVRRGRAGDLNMDRRSGGARHGRSGAAMSRIIIAKVNTAVRAIRDSPDGPRRHVGHIATGVCTLIAGQPHR